MEKINLQDYEIHIGNFKKPLQKIIEEKKYTRIVVLVDENTRKYCLPLIQRTLNKYSHFIIEIPSGEIHKNIETCSFIWKKMMSKGADRHSLTIDLGGGVIGDMGGFCASTFKRGMDFLQIPTTLLSQVDASIGGKLGIDFNHIKNSVGVFNNPKTVLVDSVFFKTLPAREIRSGFAEIVKHALIADKKQWKKIKKITTLSSVNWEEYVLPSLKIKQAIVEKDPFEAGIRKALNFGHTIGHAIESNVLESSKPLLHGEAIAIGMICESWLSYKSGNLKKKSLKEISKFILSHYGFYSIDRKSYSDLIFLMKKDKKNEGTAINFTFLFGIGDCLINQTASEELIIESLDYYSSLKN